MNHIAQQFNGQLTNYVQQYIIGSKDLRKPLQINREVFLFLHTSAVAIDYVKNSKLILTT